MFNKITKVLNFPVRIRTVVLIVCLFVGMPQFVSAIAISPSNIELEHGVLPPQEVSLHVTFSRSVEEATKKTTYTLKADSIAETSGVTFTPSEFTLEEGKKSQKINVVIAPKSSAFVSTGEEPISVGYTILPVDNSITDSVKLSYGVSGSINFRVVDEVLGNFKVVKSQVLSLDDPEHVQVTLQIKNDTNSIVNVAELEMEIGEHTLIIPFDPTINIDPYQEVTVNKQANREKIIDDKYTIVFRLYDTDRNELHSWSKNNVYIGPAPYIQKITMYQKYKAPIYFGLSICMLVLAGFVTFKK